jgi:predicted RNA binding protein YcfA (HicA-like mRNA interferase family)
MGGGFPSVKAQRLKRILMREPLNYRVTRQKGSHCRMESDVEGCKPVLFAFHDGDTIAPGLVRKILVKEAGLSEEEALRLL